MFYYCITILELTHYRWYALIFSVVILWKRGLRWRLKLYRWRLLYDSHHRCRFDTSIYHIRSFPSLHSFGISICDTKSNDIQFILYLLYFSKILIFCWRVKFLFHELWQNLILLWVIFHLWNRNKSQGAIFGAYICWLRQNSVLLLKAHKQVVTWVRVLS